MARRLAVARLLASSLKDKDSGQHVWDTQGGRYPGAPAPQQKIKIHTSGSKVADVSRAELEELKTNLEEQNGMHIIQHRARHLHAQRRCMPLAWSDGVLAGIAQALEALLREEKSLQEQLQVCAPSLSFSLPLLPLPACPSPSSLLAHCQCSLLFSSSLPPSCCCARRPD